VEGDVPDRDLVIEACSEQICPHVYGTREHFAAVVPSASFGVPDAVEAPRRVVLTLDRSGSMGGAKIEQARTAAEACLAALSATDQFGLIAFDDQLEALHDSLLPATGENRARARQFLSALEGRGGTELAAALDRAASLCLAGGDVLVFTDGEVMGTEAVLARARATGVRIHCLGIGNAAEDRFLALLARETGGLSRYVTARERIDVPAVDLFASIGQPVAWNVRIGGAVIRPEPPSTVARGMPLSFYGKAAAGTLILDWDNGRLEIEICDSNDKDAEVARLLQGARLITDIESRYGEPEHQRERDRIAARLRSLSEEYRLASREMALVAVVSRAGDKPGEVPSTRVVPVGMPQDSPFTGVFGEVAMRLQSRAQPIGKERAKLHRTDRKKDVFYSLAPNTNPERVNTLMELAARIEQDGGMPGANLSARVDSTIEALRKFLWEGNTRHKGTFRAHVSRLADWLQSVLPQLSEDIQLEARGILDAVGKRAGLFRWRELFQ
jgi:Ca-activated chloride channel family protein